MLGQIGQLNSQWKSTRSADLKLVVWLLPELYSTQSYYLYLSSNTSTSTDFMLKLLDMFCMFQGTAPINVITNILEKAVTAVVGSLDKETDSRELNVIVSTENLGKENIV